MTSLEMNLSEGHLGLSDLEAGLERQGWEGLDRCRKGIAKYTGQKEVAAVMQEKKEEDQREDS